MECVEAPPLLTEFSMLGSMHKEKFSDNVNSVRLIVHAFKQLIS